MSEEELNEATQYNLDYLEGKISIEEELEEANKEIERLNVELELYKDNQIHLINQLEQKDNIIKEVREFIKDNAMYSEEEKICCDDLYSSDCDKVLKILDKIEEKEND